MRRLIVLILALTLSSCTVAQPSGIESESIATEPLEVGLCDLRLKPAEFDKKTIKITTFAHFAFEDFSLMDPECESKVANVWIEYGGKRSAGSIYCCGAGGKEEREEQLEVKGIRTSLVADEQFKRFDELMHTGHSSLVRTTLVGRFFAAGEKGGYGHMGCCNLFVLERVEKVDERLAGLDWQGFWGGDEHLEKLNSYKFLDVPRFSEVIQMQRRADSLEKNGEFYEPKHVAIQFLEHSRGITPKERDVKIIQRTVGREVLKYEKGGIKYFITVSRPGWLSYYSRDSKKVIWTVLNGIESPYSLD